MQRSATFLDWKNPNRYNDCTWIHGCGDVSVSRPGLGPAGQRTDVRSGWGSSFFLRLASAAPHLSSLPEAGVWNWPAQWALRGDERPWGPGFSGAADSGFTFYAAGGVWRALPVTGWRRASLPLRVRTPQALPWALQALPWLPAAGQWRSCGFPVGSWVPTLAVLLVGSSSRWGGEGGEAPRKTHTGPSWSPGRPSVVSSLSEHWLGPAGFPLCQRVAYRACEQQWWADPWCLGGLSRLYTVGGNVNWSSYCGKQYGEFSKS